MPKAILELEMPENCKECLLHSWESNECTLTLICKILLVNGLPHKRRDDCPLNPAENEQLQAQVARMREALRKAMEAIKAAWSDRSVNAALDKASEALTKIGKALGGKEDV